MNDNSDTPYPHRNWLERLSHFLLREPQDREQLIQLLRGAAQRDLLNNQALTMIEGVLQVSDMQVRDIMVPRSQMVVVEQDATPEEFLPIVIESAHSRFPVMGENHQTVIGILLAKDLLAYNFRANETPFNISDILRPVVFIPESKRLDMLLQEFRINRNHIAMVVDEYGEISGLVTIEDVLEQIVGEIEDEYDVEDDTYIKKYSNTQYIVKALTPIEDFNEYFNANFSDEEFDTIGGVVLKAFGHLPKRGESIAIEPFRFRVLHADNRRVRLLKVTMRKKALDTTII